MLKTAARPTLTKQLTLNNLQNKPFRHVKRSALQAKTGHIVMPNGTYGKSRQLRLFFSCTSASMVKLRIFIKILSDSNNYVKPPHSCIFVSVVFHWSFISLKTHCAQSAGKMFFALLFCCVIKIV